MADRDFKGVFIPKEIWLNSDLNLTDKAVLVEIDSLDNGKDGCYASNKHFSEMLGCTERQASASVTKLIKMGFVEVIRFDGRTRYLRSLMKEKCVEQDHENCEAESRELPGSLTETSTLPDENFQSASRKLLHSKPRRNTKRNTLSISKNTSYSCPEPEESASTPPEPPVFSLPLNDGTEHPVTKDDFDKYVDLYPSVDVMQQLRNMYGWLDGNPSRRKTKGGIKRFISSWLAREQDRGGVKPTGPATQPQPNAFGLDRRNNKVPERYGGGIIV